MSRPVGARRRRALENDFVRDAALDQLGGCAFEMILQPRLQLRHRDRGDRLLARMVGVRAVGPRAARGGRDTGQRFVEAGEFLLEPVERLKRDDQIDVVLARPRHDQIGDTRDGLLEVRHGFLKHRRQGAQKHMDFVGILLFGLYGPLHGNARHHPLPIFLGEILPEEGYDNLPTTCSIFSFRIAGVKGLMR